MKRPKVFGIGFHKTGTSSLRQALKALGYRVTGPDFVWDEDLDWETLKTRAVIVARQFDASDRAFMYDILCWSMPRAR